MLAGRPLIAYTADAARASGGLTRVVVSTEDEEIAGLARRLGVEVPFLRPARLARDETPMLDVLIDLVASLEQREQYRPDILVLLQPTSPFRRAEHIDAAIDLLTSTGADSVVTVVPVPHQFTPSSLMRLQGDRLVPWTDGPPEGGPYDPGNDDPGNDDPGKYDPGNVGSGFSRTGTGAVAPTRRQDKPLLFARNGPAVLAVRTEVVTGARALYGADTRGLVMSRDDSFDIDDTFDLGVAELLMASRPA
jgi:CMP-N,N'-diacetyllegionaminic acid synthase